MNKANANRLCRAFPQLYGQEYGFACPDSWAPYLHRLNADLVGHAERAGLQLVVTDVKESHGALRFYVDGTDDEADRLIENAEHASKHWPNFEDLAR